MKAGRRPEGHCLYWVYAYDSDSEDIDTATDLESAKLLAKKMVFQDCQYVYIFYGDEDGPFMDLDPVGRISHRVFDEEV